MKRASRTLAVLALGLLFLAAPATAVMPDHPPLEVEESDGAWVATDKYEPGYSAHPLRIVGYVLHPVGVIVDTLILHPIWWIGSHEPFYTLFGRTD